MLLFSSLAIAISGLSGIMGLAFMGRGIVAHRRLRRVEQSFAKPPRQAEVLAATTEEERTEPGRSTRTGNSTRFPRSSLAITVVSRQLHGGRTVVAEALHLAK
ncbi:MAG: hypothetical protein U0992_19285 [Planctomycetaceae bacterium]